MDWRCRSADKSWYKPKFEWRIEFDFSAGSDARHWPIDHRWVQFLTVCEEKGWQYRKRREIFQCIYTNELELLDLVLNSEEYRTGINEIEYSSDTYLSELTNAVCGDAVTDIKFVSHLQTDFVYQVYLGGIEWKDPCKEAITSYLCNNRNEFSFRGYYAEIIHRASLRRPNQWGHYESVYDGFNFFAKSTDDILMLHMIAPGKIRKIVKIMEKIR